MRASTDHSVRNPERGSYVIEASVVTLLLLGIIFLVVDLALAVYTKSAVRAGVRFAVTEQLGANQSYLNDSIVTVVQQNAMGMLNGTNGACKIAINYYNPVTGLADMGTGGDIVEVSITGYSYKPVGILKSGTPISLTASSSDVMEQCPLLGCPPMVDPNPVSCP